LRLNERISYITGLLKRYGFQDIALKDFRPGPLPTMGWYRIEALMAGFRIVITEFISESIVKYSYTLISDSEVLLRYDNAPHHSYIRTYPHHKHVNGRVAPLEDSSIESFLREVLDIISKE